jgi:hypothetical protein
MLEYFKAKIIILGVFLDICEYSWKYILIGGI